MEVTDRLARSSGWQGQALNDFVRLYLTVSHGGGEAGGRAGAGAGEQDQEQDGQARHAGTE